MCNVGLECCTRFIRSGNETLFTSNINTHYYHSLLLRLPSSLSSLTPRSYRLTQKCLLSTPLPSLSSSSPSSPLSTLNYSHPSPSAKPTLTQPGPISAALNSCRGANHVTRLYPSQTLQIVPQTCTPVAGHVVSTGYVT